MFERCERALYVSTPYEFLIKGNRPFYSCLAWSVAWPLDGSEARVDLVLTGFEVFRRTRKQRYDLA